MSTAAPAGPTQGAPTGQPGADGIAARPEVSTGPTPTSDAAPTGLPEAEATGKDGIEVRGRDAEAGRRPIKPIPPKAKAGPKGLPGVDLMEEGEGDTAVPGPPRGPDGRFIPADAAAETPPPPGEEPPPPKFKFGGEEFENQEKAEQNFKSLRGQFKPLVERVTRAEGELSRAAESARGWHARAQELEAELEAYRQGKPPQSQPAESDQPAEKEAEGIDWDLYAEIHRLATERGETWKAEQWLAKEQQKLIDARLAAIRDEATLPQREAQIRAEIGQQTEALFTSLADYVNHDGSPAYPELSDPQAAYQIGRFWTSLGLPPEAALTPQGAIAAIALYRMAAGSQGTAQSTPAPAPAPAPPPPPPTPPAHAAAAAGLVGGRPSVVPRSGEGNVSPEAARIIAGLKQATLVRPGLGFEP